MGRSIDNTGTARRRGRSAWRWAVAVILAILIAPALVILVLIASFNPNQYAPQLIAAVDRATGRQLTLGGPIRLNFSLTPLITVSGVRLSNPPDFADSDLLTLGRLEARIALLPLLSHRIDILSLALVHPVITLETNSAGKADWDFSQTRPAGGAVPEPAAAPGHGYKIALQTVDIENGSLTIKRAGGGTPVTIGLTHLAGTADSLSAPLHLAVQAMLGKTPFSANGVVGPVERFSGLGTGPWPVDLVLQMAGAQAAVHGALAHPRTGTGYDLSVSASIPALEDIAASLPAAWLGGLKLPPIHGIAATARIVDQKSDIPAIDDLSIKAGASDLSALRPGFSLNALDLEMASLDQPLSISGSGKLGADGFSFSGKFGPPQALLNPAWLPATMPPQGSFPVTLSAAFGAAKAGISGAIATPQTLAGVALALNATIPDLAALGADAGLVLPAWKNIALQTTLIDPGGLGLRNAAGLEGLAVTMDDAAFGGAGSLYFNAPQRAQLALKFSQLNLDALLASMPKPAAPTSPTALTAAPPASPDAIPNWQLPLNLLKSASANVQLSADTLVWRQARYTALQANASLANAVLTLKPVTGQLPGGSVSADAVLDATRTPPAESLHINAPALALAPFLAAFGLPDTAQGTVQAQLDASSSGDSLPAMAASLNGQLGLATVNGVVEGALLDRLFGTVLRTVGLPEALVGAQGPVTVRCAALRMDAAGGIGTIRALTLDSSRLLVQGGGSVDFGHGTIAIILRPQLQMAGANVGVPVEIGGTFAAPVITVAPLGAVRDAAKTAVGLPAGLAQDVLGNNSILGQAASALGIGNARDVCPAALNLGRLGQPGPAAAPPAPAPAASGAATAPIPSGPKNLLNSLFGP